MFFTPFMRWMWTKLSDIYPNTMRRGTVNFDYIQFSGWGGANSIYARFQINRKELPNGNKFNKLLVAHEGNWTTEESMYCHPDYKNYEDVQNELGQGLVFSRKGFSRINKRSLFLYDFDNTSMKHILAVPATGEEIYFEIYGVDQYGSLVLLEKREL